MTREQDIGTRARQWWHDYVEPLPHRRGAARAAMARLRRTHTAMDALMEPATLDLARRLGRTRPQDLPRVGMVAAVLAHVRENDDRPVARAAGPASPSADPKKDDENAVVKYGRFRRLLQADDDDLVDQMRRLVRLLGGKANVADLAYSIFYWGDRTRQRWVFDYYALGTPPKQDAPATETAAL